MHMEFFNLANLQSSAPKAQLSGVTGELVYVSEMKDGKGTRGPWSIQSVEIEDAQGNRAKLKLWNRFKPMPREWAETRTGIKVVNDDDGKSMSVAVDEYNGKTTNVIEVRPEASITVSPGDGQQPEPTRSNTPPSRTPDNPSPAHVGSNADRVKAFVRQCGNTSLLCYAEALRVRAELASQTGVTLDMDQVHGLAQGIAVRAGYDKFTGLVGVDTPDIRWASAYAPFPVLPTDSDPAGDMPEGEES